MHAAVMADDSMVGRIGANGDGVDIGQMVPAQVNPGLAAIQ